MAKLCISQTYQPSVNYSNALETNTFPFTNLSTISEKIHYPVEQNNAILSYLPFV